MNESTNTGWSQNLHKSTATMARWTFGWLLTMALATFGPALIWDGKVTLTLAAVALNLIAGGGMIIANKNHLRSMDELQQKIHLESMALSLGVVLIGGLAYSTLDIANVISFDAEISHIVFLMGFTYLITMLRLNRKYQ